MQSLEPVIICGSFSCIKTLYTVLVCPSKQAICCRLRISQTLATQSLPPVVKISKFGCKDKQ